MAEMVSRFDVKAAQITQWKKQSLSSAGPPLTKEISLSMAKKRVLARIIHDDDGISLDL